MFFMDIPGKMCYAECGGDLMPETRSELKRYLFKALLFFIAGMAILYALACGLPKWLNQYSFIAEQWRGLVNMLVGGVCVGGVYTAGSFVARRTEQNGRGGVSVFNTGAYGFFLLIAPLTFIPAMVVALRRLFADDLPESPEDKPVRIVRDGLPRR